MSQVSPTRTNYGGQAVVEGVMIRGPRAIATAVRKPNGEIAVRTKPLSGLYAHRFHSLPLLRGILVLWETLVLGVSALSWSAAVAADEINEDGEAEPLGFSGWALLAITLIAGLTFFFTGPVLATAWLDSRLPGLLVLALEGLLRIGLLIGYIWLIGRSSGVSRVFQYHAAEHMTIHAYEYDRELRVQAIRRFPKEHPRCGTSFLLTVTVIAALAFIIIGSDPFWWRFVSRLALIPLIAAISYEVIRFAGRHLDNSLIKVIFAGNIALQYLTTRSPEDEQIQVAIASLHAVLEEEHRDAQTSLKHATSD